MGRNVVQLHDAVLDELSQAVDKYINVLALVEHHGRLGHVGACNVVLSHRCLTILLVSHRAQH
eukprot:2804315-Rhodomonas_salina.1